MWPLHICSKSNKTLASILEPQRTAAILLCNNSTAVEHHCSGKRRGGKTCSWRQHEREEQDRFGKSNSNKPKNQNNTTTKKKWGSCGFTRMIHAQVTTIEADIQCKRKLESKCHRDSDHSLSPAPAL